MGKLGRLSKKLSISRIRLDAKAKPEKLAEQINRQFDEIYSALDILAARIGDDIADGVTRKLTEVGLLADLPAPSARDDRSLFLAVDDLSLWCLKNGAWSQILP